MTLRPRLFAVLAAGAAATVLGACGTDVRSQTAEAVGASGAVVVTTQVCQTEYPIGCRKAPGAVSAGKQLLIGYRVPAGVEAPETLKARVPLGYGAKTVTLRRDDAYGAWIQQRPSPLDGPSRSAGYVSEVLPGVATDDIEVTARFDAGQVDRFEYATVTGYRTAAHGSGAERAVDCTGELQPVDGESQERFTDCMSGSASVGGEDALTLKRPGRG